MADKASNDDDLIRYLLGRLSEEERSHVERRFIGDSEYYEQLLLTEDELRFAYAKGTLDRAEREQFEKRFLIFPDEREKVELAKGMINELSSIPVRERTEPLSARGEKNNWRERLLAFAGFRSPAMRLAMAAAVVVLLLGFAWMAFETLRLREQISQLKASQTTREQEIEQAKTEQSRVEQLNRELEEERNNRAQLEQEVAQMREQASPGDASRTLIISMILAPGRVRSGGATKSVTITDDSAQLRLLLNIGDATYRSYEAAVLNSNGAQVWGRRSLRASRTAGVQSIILTIPARLLAEDDYEVNLKGLTATGELERAGEYYFTMKKGGRKK